ncbi:MAG TPA: DUF4340 domain-containing protein [Polyangiaceae bacterium]|jgi:hypothetical protein|nr:DUF4340 domain-containing protein [Polyangiaceae bacterium]
MSREKLIIAGVVVLGVLGGLVYKQAKTDADLGQPQAMSTESPTVSAPEDIDKISITNGEKGEVVLEKVPDAKGGGASVDGGPATLWMVTKPVKAEANQQTASDIVANLKDLKVESRINLKLDDDIRKDKQLDAAHATRIVAYKGGDKKLDESFGKSGPAGQLTVVNDKPDAVWAVKGFSAYLYTKDAKDFRKKEVLHFDDANATQVTVANAHGALAFTKGDSGKWGGTLNGKSIARFDEEKVKDMLRAFKTLNAEDFGDGKSLAETGLDKPEATVTVRLKDDAPAAVLLVGGVSTGTNRWVKRADDDAIYQVTSYVSDWATSDSAKYQSVADAGAPAPDAGKKK